MYLSDTNVQILLHVQTFCMYERYGSSIIPTLLHHSRSINLSILRMFAPEGGQVSILQQLYSQIRYLLRSAYFTGAAKPAHDTMFIKAFYSFTVSPTSARIVQHEHSTILMFASLSRQLEILHYFYFSQQKSMYYSDHPEPQQDSERGFFPETETELDGQWKRLLLLT